MSKFLSKSAAVAHATATRHLALPPTAASLADCSVASGVAADAEALVADAEALATAVATAVAIAVAVARQKTLQFETGTLSGLRTA